MGTSIPEENLLGEVEELIRNMPSGEKMRGDDETALDWISRARAVATYLKMEYRAPLTTAIDGIRTILGDPTGVRVLLKAAHHDLRMRTVGPVSVAVGAGMGFHYFDTLSDIIKEGRSDIFFVDPFLNKDFVSRYLGFVSNRTKVRLLASRYITTLIPSVEQFAKEHGLTIEVRSSVDFHDRYVFIDGSSCYMSGASFKDGGTKPTVFLQIVDAFPAVQKTYEELWAAAKVRYPIL